MNCNRRPESRRLAGYAQAARRPSDRNIRGRLMKRIVFALLPVILLAAPAAAQDIRGLEACMAEKQMERRTGCLQANVEFLQQALAKLTRETNQKLSAAERDIAAGKTEITALKAALAK